MKLNYLKFINLLNIMKSAILNNNITFLIEMAKKMAKNKSYNICFLFFFNSIKASLASKKI